MQPTQTTPLVMPVAISNGSKSTRKLIWLFLIIFFFLQVVVNGQNTLSVPFVYGAIGTQGTNPQQANNISNFPTLLLNKAYFIQSSSTSQFQIQGNDIPGTLRLVTATNKYVDVQGAIVWRQNSGTTTYIGFIPAASVTSFNLSGYGGANYTVSNTSNIILRFNNTNTTFTNGSNISGNAGNISDVLSTLNAYLATTASSRPLGPVTVNSLTTTSTSPIVTGTVTLRAGESLSVEVNGVSYTTGSRLSVSGTTWSLSLPLSAGLAYDNTYSVSAIITNTDGYTLVDNTNSELVIQRPAASISITGSGTANSIVNNAATAIDASLSISAQDNITDFTVSISDSYITGDILSYTGSLPSGVTTTGFNTTTRSIVFKGTKTASEWQEFLRRVTLQTSSAVCYPERRKITFIAGETYYNILNGHFYRPIVTGASWTNSKTTTQSTSYYGRQGYLVTITSAAENSFISRFVGQNSWIGASDNYLEINAAVGYTKYADQNAAEGYWHWVTGPEKGTQMRNGNANDYRVGSTIAGVYQNWAGGEPNDWQVNGAAGNEDYGHIYSGSGTWNDFPDGSSIGSIYEFGEMPNDNTNATPFFTRDITVQGASGGKITGGEVSVCSGTNSTVLTITGLTGTVSSWESSLDNFITAGTTISHTGLSYTVANLTQTTYYRAIVNSTSPNTCAGLSTSSTVISVTPSNGGNIIAPNGNTICVGGEIELTLSGHTGTVQKWQSSTNNSTWTDIISNSINFSEVVNTAGTYYYRAVVANSCGTSVNSSSITVTVQAGTSPVGGTVSGASHVSATNSGTLTLSGYTGTVQKWQQTIDNGIVWTDIANTATTYSYSNISKTTMFRARLQSGSCGFAYSNAGVVEINLIVAPSGLSYSGPNVYTRGIAITSLTPTVTGTVTSYSVSPSLPAGLSLNTSTGVITGTPTAVNTQANYTVTASNSAGSTTAVVSITVNDVAPNGLSYTSPNLYTRGVAINNLTPTVTGTVTSYSVSPSLPSGLSLNTSTGVISGTPTAVTAQANYTVTASNSGGSATASLTITVKDNPTISLGNMTKTFGNAPFGVSATSNSTGAITYSSSNTSVATISGSTVTIVGAGSATITASQVADANYNAGTTTASLTVGKASPTISLGNMTKTYSDASFNLNATSNSTGAITYSSSNTSVATISGNTVTIVGAGSATITASQASDANYNAGTTTASLTVGKASPTISLGNMTKTYGDASFNLNASSNSTGAITYSSSNTSVATISGSTVTIVGAGSATITASQVADVNYNAGTTTASLTVGKASPTISLGNMTKTYGNAPFSVGATSNSTGAITYSSSNTSVATISGSTVTIVGAGNATITASQVADANYNAGTTTASLTVGKASPTISLGNMTKTYGNAPFGVGATSNSTGAITYSSSNTSVATISGNTVTIVGAGNATITASQASDANYNAGTTTASLTVGKASPTISLGNMTKTYGDASFNLNASSNSTGAITYSSSNTSVATISGSTVTIVGAGSATITASQVADVNYNAGTTTASLTVGKASPTISLGNMTKTYGNAPFGVGATSNSTGAITYSSSNTSVATISGNTVTIVGAGNATITASQASDANYNAGTTTASLTVGKASPTISLGNVTKTYGNASFNLNATSNSTGAITYSSSNTSVATISGNTVTILGAGSATITASQVADANYNAGTTTASLTVGKASPTISLGNMTKTYSDASFNLNATSNSTGAITYSSSNTSVATISGNTVTIVGAGSATITASQASDANYNAGTTTASLTVGKASPTISLGNMTKTYGDASFSLNATSNSTGAITYSSSNTSVATISGSTVTIVGAGSATITASQQETSDYLASQVSATITIAKQKASIAIEDISKNYGDPDVELKASSASMGSYSFVSSNTSVARIIGTTLSIVGAGQAVITVQQVETENYASNSKDIKLNVAKAPLSLVADNKVKCNNSPNPVFTFTATGFVRNDDVTAISRKPEYKLISASSAEDAYIIRPFAAEAKDYVINYGDGMLTEHTINPVRVEPDYAKVAKGTNVTIRAFGNSVAYQWNAVPGILTSLNGDRIVARVFAKTAYSVTMTDPNGCKTTGSYEVDVNEDINISPAIVLSPNGDGRNDKFVIDNIDLYPENKLQVFDRTGKMLYEAVNYRNNWDGRVNGALLVKDNYFYVLTVKGQVVKRGSITVVR